MASANMDSLVDQQTGNGLSFVDKMNETETNAQVFFDISKNLAPHQQ